MFLFKFFGLNFFFIISENFLFEPGAGVEPAIQKGTPKRADSWLLNIFLNPTLEDLQVVDYIPCLSEPDAGFEPAAF